MNIQKIAERLSQTAQAKIIVFGDYALDKYLYIDPKRDEPSAETGLSAYQVHRKSMAAGVGGTITNNLRAMGAQVICIGIVGEDGEGVELLRELEMTGADTRWMVKDPSLCTSTYMKPMRKNPLGIYEEMNRLDLRNFEEPSMETQKKLLQNLEEALEEADAVLITDQFYQRNMGVVTDYVRDCLAELADRRKDRIFYADSRSFMQEFRNMMVKCNNLELFSLFSGGDGDPEDLEQIIARGKEIYARNGNPVFVTRGKEGIVVFEKEVSIVPAFLVEGETDICGAGDATNAGIVLGLTLGLSTAQAALLGCCISSITITQLGTTGTASVEEVRKKLLDLCRKEGAAAWD